MQVILLERVEKLGQMGDEVKVRDGFARNFLLPKKKALRATAANREYFQTQKAQFEAHNLKLRSEAEKVADKLNGQVFTLIRQAGDRGQLYGSVSPRDVSAAITEGGFTVDRHQVHISTAIKTVGLFSIPVVLHPEVKVTISVNVARSEDEAVRQARGEDVLAEKTDAEEVLEAAQSVFEDGAAPAEQAGEEKASED